MYPNLKLQLWKCGLRQNRLAQMIGIHETLLSRIVNGFREPDAAVRARIAAVLTSDEEWLFAPNDRPQTVTQKRRLSNRGPIA